MSDEIRPKMVDGSPVCSGDACPRDLGVSRKGRRVRCAITEGHSCPHYHRARCAQLERVIRDALDPIHIWEAERGFATAVDVLAEVAEVLEGHAAANDRPVPGGDDV